MPINVVDGDSYEAPRTVEPDCDWPVIMNCSPSTAFDLDISAMAQETAADIMNAATARRYGVCTSTFAPAPPPPCTVGHQDAWSLVDPKVGGLAAGDVFSSFYNGSGGTWCMCGGGGHNIRLWHTRVVDIVQVVIAGQVVDPATYYLDGNTLVRDDDNKTWPVAQNGRRGGPESWEITYRHGIPVPRTGAIATGALACEIAMALADDEECSLPQRTKTYTNHAGLTIGFIDPMEFLTDGLTGLYVPDQWIKRTNPHGIARRARAYSYRKHRRGARRITNPESLASE